VDLQLRGRIFAVPVVTLPIVEKAIEELEWVVERGAKTILIRPAPVPGFRGSRSFGYPEFDPFWKAVVDADILVCMHSSDSGYSRYTSDWTGPSEMLPFRLDAFRMLTAGKRPMEDSMAALCCHGVFSRFPDLRVASIESGSDWVTGTFVHHLEDVYKKIPQEFEKDPGRAVQDNVYISPFHEDDLGGSSTSSVPITCCSGRTFRTPRGWPSRAAMSTTSRRDSPDDDLQNIMGGNLARIMRVDAAVGAAN
jgi:hypothetical protein